jgi:hypothetical protein
MLNGWSDDEIDRLARKTAAPRDRVEAFCRAVDKRLYMMLDERQRRATLHFHLRPEEPRADPEPPPPRG